MHFYKITLTPVGSFFFGGEQTFDNGSSQSYLAHSNRYPQQTTLLGMIRYQLLKYHNLLPLSAENKDTAAKIIGKNSFCMSVNKKQSFGHIKAISPVFIQNNNNEPLLPTPFTHGMEITFNGQDAQRLYLNGQIKNAIPECLAFDSKVYSTTGTLIASNQETKDLVKYSDIFLSTSQIGITKADNLDDDKKGFYKQVSFRFKESGTCFAFYLALDEDLDQGDKKENKMDEFVFIGAQRSCFKMSVEKLPNDTPFSDKTGLPLPFVPEHPQGSVLIVSPTYVTDINKLNKCCRFHWSLSMPFRNFIQDDKGTLKSGSISYRRHSALCTFLAPGSVLFYEQDKKDTLLSLLKKDFTMLNRKDALLSLLKNDNLHAIGYNYFHVN